MRNIETHTQKQYPGGSIQTCVHQGGLGKTKDFLNKTDVTESCSREKMNTKWRIYKLTNLSVFAALLKDVPISCSDAVLLKLVLKNHTISCPRYEENTRQPYNNNLCLLPALTLHLHGTQRPQEKTSIYFKIFSNKMNGLSTDQFHGVHMNDIITFEVC